MRYWMWIALTAACGQMVRAPGSQAAPGQATPEPPGSDIAPRSFDPPAASGTRSEPALEDPADGPPGRAPQDADAAGARAPAASRGDRGASRASPEQAWVDAHNRARAKHCARPLAWSPKLAQVAQRWANSLRDRGCQFGHSGGSFGENLAAGTSGTLDPGSVVKMWYDEVAQYRFPDGGFSMQTGHFTQVVWRGTTAVGCGRSTCKGMDIFVCEYNPAGNWEGQYRQNVLPAGCRER